MRKGDLNPSLREPPRRRVRRRYASSAVVADGTSPPPVADSYADYVQTATPGCRAPHVWLGRPDAQLSTLDLFGSVFTLLAAPEAAVWCEAAARASDALGVRMDCYRIGAAGLNDLGGFTSIPGGGKPDQDQGQDSRRKAAFHRPRIGDRAGRHDQRRARLQRRGTCLALTPVAKRSRKGKPTRPGGAIAEKQSDPHAPSVGSAAGQMCRSRENFSRRAKICFNASSTSAPVTGAERLRHATWPSGRTSTAPSLCTP